MKAKVKKYVKPTDQGHKPWEAVIAMQGQLNSLDDDVAQLFDAVDQLDEAICPKVAARLTALEKAIQTKAQGRAHDRLGNPLPRSTQEQPLAIKYTLLLQAVDALFASVNGSAGPYHARVQLRALDALSHIRKQL